MAPSRTPTDRGGATATVVRRAPFAGSRIAARGQRTQQRILDAALQVFSDEGYHQTSVDRIAATGGCSRVAFYQYFASKDAVFQHLADQVDRQLAASTDRLGPLTPEDDGRAELRDWVERQSAIYERYRPVFNTYQRASAREQSADGSVARFAARVTSSTLPPRQSEPVIALLIEALTHTFDIAGVLRSVVPDAYPEMRVVEVATDVIHRALFGRRAAVNVHRPAGPFPPALELPPATAAMLRRRDDPEPGPGARAALLESAREVFVTRGYHNTRVEDLISAAGVSRGAFYKYFCDKGELARVLNARAVSGIANTLALLPEALGREGRDRTRALRRWLRTYNAVQVGEAAMLRVWVEGSLEDPKLTAESAPQLDWGRRQLADALRPRGFGDVDFEAIVFVALLGVFGARPRPAHEINAAALVIERALLGGR